MTTAGHDDATDTAFADLAQALAAAQQARRVRLTAAVTGTQACYYLGEEQPPPDAPRNFFHVPIDRLADFIADTRVRPPRTAVPPVSATHEQRQAFGALISRELTRGIEERQRRGLESMGRYRQTTPPRATDGRLRVFAASSRTTTVMQYSSAGLMRAFERLGHDARLELERDDTELMDLKIMVEAAEAFAPHLVVNINHQMNTWLPPGVVNATWWQDLMPTLRQGRPLPWRQNDLAYMALTNDLAAALARTGLSAERAKIQPFCIEAETFHDRSEGPRANKIVFVGSAASTRLRGGRGERELAEMLAALVESGHQLTEEQVRGLGVLKGVPPDHAFHNVFYYVMRDGLVRWLCRASPIPVEVYGRSWDKDPEVAPHYRGERPHGPAVAEVYRGAKYALIVHPLSINTQRLAEATACGAIPVVYDCRPFADRPHWDDRLLFFRTPAQLAHALTQTPPTYASEFRDFFSYERFARRILADAAPFLS